MPAFDGYFETLRFLLSVAKTQQMRGTRHLATGIG
jgi:hypothetical protein